MARKPEIQYIGQFYVYGSEAKQLEVKEKVKKEKIHLPLPKFETIRKIQVEPVAIGSIVIAMVLLFAMVLGTVRIQSAWAEYNVMNDYVTELQNVHAERLHNYRVKCDLDKIKATALSLGMVPASELETITVDVTVPQKAEEPSFFQAAWEEFKWFIDGLL